MTTENPAQSAASESREPATGESASALLTHEHHEVDAALLDFVGGLDRGEYQPQPVLDAITSLRRHIYLEEALMFPPLATGGMVMPIAVMLREHGQLWRTMDTLAVLLTGGDGPEIRRKMRALCEDLLSQLEGHNTKEEQIIYGTAQTALSAEQQRELVAAIETADLPYGWVPKDAFARN